MKRDSYRFEKKKEALLTWNSTDEYLLLLYQDSCYFHIPFYFELISVVAFSFFFSAYTFGHYSNQLKQALLPLPLSFLCLWLVALTSPMGSWFRSGKERKKKKGAGLLIEEEFACQGTEFVTTVLFSANCTNLHVVYTYSFCGLLLIAQGLIFFYENVYKCYVD